MKTLQIRIDPIIPIILGEARCDEVLYRKLVNLSLDDNLTIVYNGVMHISDDAIEAWYQYKEGKDVGLLQNVFRS